MAEEHHLEQRLYKLLKDQNELLEEGSGWWCRFLLDQQKDLVEWWLFIIQEEPRGVIFGPYQRKRWAIQAAIAYLIGYEDGDVIRVVDDELQKTPSA